MLVMWQHTVSCSGTGVTGVFASKCVWYAVIGISMTTDTQGFSAECWRMSAIFISTVSSFDVWSH